MEDNEKKVTQYLIPANVSARFEFFEGFGWYELKIVLIASLIGTIIFFSLGIFKKTVYVNVNNMQIEMTIGADEEIKPNQEGVVKKSVPYIPSILRALAIIIPATGAFFLVKRDPTSGMSLMYMIKAAKKFKSKQRLYLYKYNSGSEV